MRTLCSGIVSTTIVFFFFFDESTLCLENTKIPRTESLKIIDLSISKVNKYKRPSAEL